MGILRGGYHTRNRFAFDSTAKRKSSDLRERKHHVDIPFSDVLEMRRLHEEHNYTPTMIASTFGISYNHATRILNGEVRRKE